MSTREFEMKRVLIAAALATLLGTTAARAQTDQQALVDRATLTVQEIMGSSSGHDVQSTLHRAVGVMVCPRIFKAAFFFGGSGGGCVLSTRDGGGSWSYPAFYSMGSGSAGLQFGIQDAELMMMIMTRRGLQSVMDDQFRFGGDASLAIATIGGGLEGATTAALGADIVVVFKARGLFAGIALTGSVMSTRTEWDRAYYGRDLAARQIVVDMAVRNPGADPLRETLTRFGGSGPAGPSAATTPPPGYSPPAYPPPAYPPPAYPQSGGAPTPLTPYAPQPQAPIQSQSLPPPHG
jgi:lipid-binding SYLF domain-containing protein